MAEANEDLAEAVNNLLRDWCQGDCVVADDLWFLFRINANAPITEQAKAAAEDDFDADAVDMEARGFMVASQTCDIRRDCDDRPFLEVHPLVEVAEGPLLEIQKGRRPNYASVPGLSDRRLVADLDRTMTVEKAVLSAWDRIPGCTRDRERRHLAKTLARKRERFAFPDDFVELAAGLRNRLIAKHEKQSAEGLALRALREIRVKATPDWNAQSVELFFFFIRNADSDSKADEHLKHWLDLIKPVEGSRFKSVEGVVWSLDDMTARDYVDSDPLDLDYLSRVDV